MKKWIFILAFWSCTNDTELDEPVSSTPKNKALKQETENFLYQSSLTHSSVVSFFNPRNIKDLLTSTQKKLNKEESIIALRRLNGDVFSHTDIEALQKLSYRRLTSSLNAPPYFASILDLAIMSARKNNGGATVFFLKMLETQEDAFFKSEAANIRGIIAQSNGQFAEALEKFDAALAIDKTNDAARLNKIHLLLQFQYQKEAATLAKDLKKDKLSQWALLLLEESAGRVVYKTDPLCTELEDQQKNLAAKGYCTKSQP